MIFKKLASETLWFTGSKILGILSGFIVVPFMTKYLSPTETGLYSLIMGLQLVIGTIISLQLHQPINVQFFEFNGYERKKLFTQSLLTLLIVASVFLTFLLVTIGYFLDHLESSLTNSLIEVKFGIILAYLSCFYGFFEYLFRAAKKSNILFLISLIVSLLDFTLKIYFLSLGFGIKGLLLVMATSTFLYLIFFLYVFKESFVKVKYEKKILEDSLKYSIPLIPYSFLAALALYVDRILLEKYFTLEILGIYFISQKIASLGKFLTNQISLSFQPFFFEKSKVNLKDGLKSAENFSYFQIITTMLFVITTNIFSKELFGLFLNDNYLNAYSFFLILNLGSLCRVFYNVKAVGLFLIKKTKFVFTISLITTLTGVLLNLIIIKFTNFNSIPFIVVFSQLLSYLIVEFYYDKFINIRIDKILILFSMSMIILSYLPFIKLLENTFYSSISFKLLIFFFILIFTYAFYFRSLKEKIKLI